MESIRKVASQVAPDLKGLVTEAQIVNGLKTVKNLTKYKTLRMDFY